MRRRTIATIAIATAACGAVVVSASPEVRACRCVEPSPRPLGDALSQADVAIVARIGAVVDDEDGADRPARGVAFEVTVERAFKGWVTRDAVVSTGRTSCALRRLAEGETWLLFLREREEAPRLIARQCVGSRLLKATPGAPTPAWAKRWIAHRGDGVPIREAPRDGADDGDSSDEGSSDEGSSDEGSSDEGAADRPDGG